jgi:hypothetical protein
MPMEMSIGLISEVICYSCLPQWFQEFDYIAFNFDQHLRGAFLKPALELQSREMIFQSPAQVAVDSGG